MFYSKIMEILRKNAWKPQVQWQTQRFAILWDNSVYVDFYTIFLVGVLSSWCRVLWFLLDSMSN